MSVQHSAEANSPAARDPTARDPTAWAVAGVPGRADLRGARAFCRAVAARHYENFPVVSLLVPKRLRQDFANVYAFARWSDDLADESSGPQEASERLAEWREGLERCFRGRPDHPVYVALADTAGRKSLSIDPFRDLLDAFEQDQRRTRYATRSELLDYCRRSANPVGRIVLALDGCRDPEAARLADAICTGLQLVNFWQDMRRDGLAGRVYVPSEDLARHGVRDDDLKASEASADLRAMTRDLVAWARDCFDEGSPLVSIAPRDLRPAIAAFLAGGRAVAGAIERRGFDTLSGRPVLDRWTKVKLVAGVVASRLRPDRGMP